MSEAKIINIPLLASGDKEPLSECGMSDLFGSPVLDEILSKCFSICLDFKENLSGQLKCKHL